MGILGGSIALPTRYREKSGLLAGLKINKGKPNKSSPGQMAFPWAQWETPAREVQQVAEKFVFANCYNQQAAGVMMRQCQVSES